MRDDFGLLSGECHSVAGAWTGGWHGVPGWIGVGDEAMEKNDLWTSVVTNDATSGADLIVPPGAYELSQQGRGDDLKILGMEGGGV